MIVTFGALGVFFAVIVVVLHISKNRQSVATFSNYAVGERSFSSWFVSWRTRIRGGPVRPLLRFSV